MRDAIAPQASPVWNALKTILGQCVVLSFFFGLIPLLVMHLHWRISISELGFHPLRPLAVLIAIFATAVYMSSALTLSWIGRGTPLPFDAPRRLVVVGPYSLTRSPMMLGAGGYFIAATLYGGSWLVGGYAILGLIWWGIVLRRHETAVLTLRFGRAYEAYRRAVPLVFPRLTPWVPIDDAPARAIVAEGDTRAQHRGRRR